MADSGIRTGRKDEQFQFQVPCSARVGMGHRLFTGHEADHDRRRYPVNLCWSSMIFNRAMLPLGLEPKGNSSRLAPALLSHDAGQRPHSGLK